MPKKLTDIDMDELKNWLVSKNVNIVKLHRDFSDVKPMAMLIKQHFPKLVDLYNYPPRNSVQLKFSNWEAFNYKVLKKLGLVQNRKILEDISRSTPGAIETLLHKLHLRIKEKGDNDADSKSMDKEKINKNNGNNDDYIVITVNKTVGNSVLQVPQKMVSHTIYQSALKESQSKDSHLEAAYQKITHLENILKMKDDHIKELNQQLLKYSSYAKIVSTF